MLRTRDSAARLALAFVLLLFQATAIIAQTEPLTQAENRISTDVPPQVDEATKTLHDKLAKYLGGTKWTGQFTMVGKDNPRTEHYEIISAEKAEIGDYWNLVARIKYGDHDKTFPLPPIEIKFAGATPVITVDEVFFPGFGIFDARVLIRKGQYAGTWAHVGDKEHGIGGHMFGTIEKMDAKEVKKKAQAVQEKQGNQNSGDAEKGRADQN